MTVIERLHKLVDDLPPERWPDAEERLRGLLAESPKERWHAATATLRRRRPAGVTDEEVEADITREMEEMRAERIARREARHAA